MDTVRLASKPVLHYFAVTPVNDDRPQISPSGFVLEQSYPNPFNPAAVIRFQLHRPGYVVLKVYNALGEEIAVLFEGELPEGMHSARFDVSQIPRRPATGLASGVYFYRLHAHGFTETKKLIVLR